MTSVQFTKNQKYLLSCGKDGTVRLWELSTGRQVRFTLVLVCFFPLFIYCPQVYRFISTHIAGMGVQQKARIAAAFTCNEDYIFGSDENSFAVIIWDSRTGEQLQRLTGHNNVVRYVSLLASMHLLTDH